MNIIKRTCATCAAFNPSATQDEEPCGNLVFFTIHHVDADGKPLTIHQAPSPTDRCDSHQTHEEDAAETHDIEVARQVKESTPEFLAAMSACLALVESLGMEHPDTIRATQRAMALAPPSMHDFAAHQAQELGLIPEVDGYTDDGQPVYSLEAIAAKLDMSMEEAKDAMEAMLTDRAELGLPAALVDPDKVHRKH
ncbi:hypothetical protein BH10PSE16_BH10PSE16_33010 [soil metagenome]